MVAKVPLLQFDDNSYPDELIVKLQGMDKLWAFKNRIVVPIAHIESIKIAEPANIQDKRLVLVKVSRLATFWNGIVARRRWLSTER